MMGLSETMLFYLLVGLAVAVAVWITGADRPNQRLFRAVTAMLFWPLYVPMLLTPEHAQEPRQALTPTPPADELSGKIAEVERELDAAFSSLDGWAEDALSRERDRILELRSAWNSQADRIREMDHLLADSHGSTQLDDVQDRPSDPIHQSEQARRDNSARLHQVRDRAYKDLTTTLARVRELVSLIHLAKFTGAPASRAEQLVIEIAASVEGLSEVAAWCDPPAKESETRDVSSITEIRPPSRVKVKLVKGQTPEALTSAAHDRKLEGLGSRR